jgi:enoyl-CoA hydratase
VNTSDYEFITVGSPAEHVTCITLNRPEAANALSLALFAELNDALDAIDSDDAVRVWMITGAPRPDGRAWFSAGADLKGGGPTPEKFVNPRDVVNRIDEMLKPSIAVISGFCTTGGLELAMACDIRFAARSARLSDWHLKATGLGIGQWGAAVRLARLVGTDRAKELLLTGREIDGDEAAAIGLVQRSIDDDELDTVALTTATTIAAMPRKGVRTTLGFLAMQERLDKHAALELADRAPELMGLTLRPFADASKRFEGRQSE